MAENILQRTYDHLYNAYLALGVCATMAAMNLLDPQELVVRADSSLPLQAERAFPSALPTPHMTGIASLDLGIQLAETAVTIEVVRIIIPSQKRLLATAVVAQTAACTADAIVDRTVLPLDQRNQTDVGFSAISDAWISESLLRSADKRQSRLACLGLRAAALTWASYATVGEYMLNGTHGGMLDLSSHAAGIAVGVGAYALDRRKHLKTTTSK